MSRPVPSVRRFATPAPDASPVTLRGESYSVRLTSGEIIERLLPRHAAEACVRQYNRRGGLNGERAELLPEHVVITYPYAAGSPDDFDELDMVLDHDLHLDGPAAGEGGAA